MSEQLKTEVATAEPQQPVVAKEAKIERVLQLFEANGFERAVVLTVRDLVMPKQSNLGDLFYYMVKCREAGVSPISRQIIPTYIGGKITLITTRSALQAIADSTGCYGGCKDFTFDEGLTLYQHLKEERGSEIGGQFVKHPMTATATLRKWVPKAAQWVEIERTVAWDAYFPKESGKQFMWKKMPHWMLAKCAESAVLHAGHPERTAALYSEAEMDQAFDDREYQADRAQVLSTVEGLPVEESGVSEKTEAEALDEVMFLLEQHGINTDALREKWTTVCMGRENADALTRINQLQKTPLDQDWAPFIEYCAEQQIVLGGPKTIKGAVNGFLDRQAVEDEA